MAVLCRPRYSIHDRSLLADLAALLWRPPVQSSLTTIFGRMMTPQEPALGDQDANYCFDDLGNAGGGPKEVTCATQRPIAPHSWEISGSYAMLCFQI
jgi:hypothetical protein